MHSKNHVMLNLFFCVGSIESLQCCLHKWSAPLPAFILVCGVPALLCNLGAKILVGSGVGLINSLQVSWEKHGSRSGRRAGGNG